MMAGKEIRACRLISVHVEGEFTALQQLLMGEVGGFDVLAV